MLYLYVVEIFYPVPGSLGSARLFDETIEEEKHYELRSNLLVIHKVIT